MATGTQMALAPDSPGRRKFSRDEVQRMLDSGILQGERLELIDGDLIDKMGQNPRHAFGIRRVTAALAREFGMERVLVQLPIEVAETDQKLNQPEPDLAVCKEELREDGTRHPLGNELLLVVEVSDATLRQDTTVKRDLYARAGVPEYWVLDVAGRRLFIHRRLKKGAYQRIETLGDEESVDLGKAAIRVADLLS